MNEKAILIDHLQPKVGIMADPSQSPQNGPLPGIIIFNAGLVHHVGPNCIFVKLARRLAENGFTVLRFDHSSIGDSETSLSDQPFDQLAIGDAKQAMDFMRDQRGIEQFMLIGLCSGAVTAFNTACVDRRVTGIVMINARRYRTDNEWMLYVMNKGWARWYWKRSLFNFASWRKAFTGKTQYRRLAGVIHRQIKDRITRSRKVPEVAQKLASDLHGLIERHTRILLVYSQDDHGLDYIRAILGKDLERLQANGALKNEIVLRSDHTFTLLKNQKRLFKIIENWIAARFPT